MTQEDQALLTLAVGIAVIGAALLYRGMRGGAGDDASTAAGRTYGANPEPDDGGPEPETPLWRDHLDLDLQFDGEFPRGLSPRRRPTQDDEDPE